MYARRLYGCDMCDTTIQAKLHLVTQEIYTNEQHENTNNATQKHGKLSRVASFAHRVARKYYGNSVVKLCEQMWVRFRSHMYIWKCADVCARAMLYDSTIIRVWCLWSVGVEWILLNESQNQCKIMWHLLASHVFGLGADSKKLALVFDTPHYYIINIHKYAEREW